MGRIERPRQRGGRGFEAAALVVAGKEGQRGRFQGLVRIPLQPLPKRGGYGMHDDDCVLRLKIVEFDPQSPESVPPPAAGKSQGHGELRDCSVVIAYHLRDEGFTPPIHSGRQLLFIGTAEQQSNEPGSFKQSGVSEFPVRPLTRPIRLRGHERREFGDQFVGNVRNQPAEHGGHQRTLFVGEASALFEEEIRGNNGQPIPPRARTRTTSPSVSSSR